MPDEDVETTFMVVLKGNSMGAAKRDSVKEEHARRLLRHLQLAFGDAVDIYLGERVLDDDMNERMEFIEIRFGLDDEGNIDPKVVQIGEPS